jgi:hypothetical protein
MLENVIDLEVIQGTALTIYLTITDDSNVATDLTGFTFRGQIRPEYTSSKAYDFTCTVEDAVNGEAKCVLPYDTFNTLKFNEPLNYVYDIEQVNGGTPNQIQRGRAVIYPKATK